MKQQFQVGDKVIINSDKHPRFNGRWGIISEKFDNPEWFWVAIDNKPPLMPYQEHELKEAESE